MKKSVFILIFSIVVFCTSAIAQNSSDISGIDVLLIKREYEKVIDTCRQILVTDSLNAEIYYQMGLAYQNILPDDKSFDCFLRAATIAPDTNIYAFMLAKSYYNKGKMKQARPFLMKLCSLDSLNWSYAYYLTSIYMKEGRYDESLEIYKRFYKRDSSDYIILDKIGFALLRKGDFEQAIDIYNRSLALNPKNVNVIKNLSFLYASTKKADTAVKLLTRGIEIDSTDMDLYLRRASIYFSRLSNKAISDYLKILSSGDTSVLYLKRIGALYLALSNFKEALPYLLKAYDIDSSDFYVNSHIAYCYIGLDDIKSSIYYYNRNIKLLSPLSIQLGSYYILLAKSQQLTGLYKDAIDNYLKGNELSPDMNIYMIVANLYDEILNNIPKSVYYYQQFLNNYKNDGLKYRQEYIDSVKERLEYLKKQQQIVKK